jgi:hypothetical protein
MNEIFNFVASAVTSDTPILRVLLIITGFAGLAHFGLRTYFIPRIAPYALRLSCALTAMLCGSMMFAAVNAPQILVLFLASMVAVVYTAYDLLAWHCGVDVSGCFKCPKNKTNLLESLKD